jgi:hypothetical protein
MKEVVDYLRKLQAEKDAREAAQILRKIKEKKQ